MKIAIEAQRIFRKDKHGMDFVALETIRELQKRQDGNEYFILVAPGEDVCLEESDNSTIVELSCPTYPLWEQVALPFAVKRLGVDMLHCTSNTAPLWCPVPLILTLHDIIYLEPRAHRSASLYQEMGWHYRRLVVPRILKHCSRILTVSHFEQQRITEALQLPKDRVQTVYNGYNLRFHPLSPEAQQAVKSYIPDEGFLFFLGNTDPKKNTAGVLKGYAEYLQHSLHKRKLLIADLKEEALEAILKAEQIEAIRPYIYCPGYIRNDHLPAIYNAAFAFLYPSLRESFGIPMIEAMACGTPAIVSNTSAMPEVAGEGALFVDPFQPSTIAQALLQLESNPQLQERQRAYGLLRAQRYSWASTAEAWSRIYNEVGRENKRNHTEEKNASENETDIEERENKGKGRGRGHTEEKNASEREKLGAEEKKEETLN